jgi:alpha-galactosidase
MSSTWGDRNTDKVVSEGFMFKELEVAKDLGVDVVQIDDGWQRVKTGVANQLRQKGEFPGLYAYDPRCWEIDAERFPHGFAPLVEYASRHGMKLGLWFAPDTVPGYPDWAKDAETILGYFREYDIRHFKLDWIHVESKRTERNILRMLRRVTRESGGAATFNLDVTAGVRLGYLYEKMIGNIFVANRYTDYVNYYPHTVLRNLWLLSELMPAAKLQLVFLNPQRNRAMYGIDPLAPAHHSMDYLFATVMVASPLAWMEMQHLTDPDRALLARVVAAYKKEREALFDAEVVPVGAEPNGASFTGFQMISDAKSGYLLLFRESTSGPDGAFDLVDLGATELETELLYANGPPDGVTLPTHTGEGGRLPVKMAHPRTFAFAKYRVR